MKMHVGFHQFLGEITLFLSRIVENLMMKRANTAFTQVDLALPVAKCNEVKH
jgi:hypothetical protein